MNLAKGFFKGIYYFLLGPLYQRLRTEVENEAHSLVREQTENLTKELSELTKKFDKLNKEFDKVSRELERVKHINLEQQNRIANQVSTEFLKMYEMIEDIKCDRTDVKLNVTLVNELVKIHQSIESIKHGQHGNGKALSQS